ncbi:unnamed protein product [Adineta steineri]|nr:unnamed protein product [Adineta steineri]
MACFVVIFIAVLYLPQGDAIQHPAGIDRLDHLINKRSATTLNATCLTKAFKHYNHTIQTAFKKYKTSVQTIVRKYKTSVQTALKKYKTTVRGAHKVYDDTVQTALKKYKPAFEEAYDEYDNAVQRADEVYDNAVAACYPPPGGATAATSCIADGEACTVGGPKCCAYVDRDYVGLDRVTLTRDGTVYGCVVRTKTVACRGDFYDTFHGGCYCVRGR